MKKLIKDKIFIGIITGLVFPILASIIYDLIKSKTLFSTIWDVLKWIYSLIMTILTFKIPLWVILLIIIIIIVILIIIAKLPIKEEPEFIKYTKDTIRGNTWTWSWDKNYAGEWHVINLKVKCPKCQSTMIEYQDYIFACPMCKFDTVGKEFDKPYEIKSIIIDKVKNNTYHI